MKRSILCPIVALVYSGCAPKAESPMPAGPATTVVFCQADSTTAWGKMYDREVADEAKSLGPQLKLSEFSANGDAARQSSQVEEAIAKKPRILMVSPVSEQVLPAVARAKKAGIYVFVLDLYKKDFNGADTYYGPDLVASAAGGPIDYGRLLHQKGTMLVLTGPKGSAYTKAKEAGAALGCSKNNLKEVLSPDCGGSRSKAKAYVASYLTSGKPVNAIYGLNEQMALGAVDAVREAHARVTYIFAFGATEVETLSDIQNGSLTAAIAISPGAVPALEEVPTVVSGGRVPKASIRPNDLISKDNVADFMKRNGLSS